MPIIKLSNKQKVNYKFDNCTKTVLVFIHGLGSNLTVWKKEYDYFKEKGYGVLSVDLQCHGSSSCRKKSGFEQFVKDIRLLIKKLKIQKVILIGHSLGGLIALDYYRRYPKNVKAIISIDSSYEISLKTLNPFVPLQFVVRKVMTMIMSKRKNKPHKVDFQKFKGKSDLEIIYELDSSMGDFIDRSSIMEDLLKIEFYSLLEKIKIPVLVVASSDDEVFMVKVSKEMAKRIPDGHFQKIKGTHSIVSKNPVEIDHIIESFLKKQKLI